MSDENYEEDFGDFGSDVEGESKQDEESKTGTLNTDQMVDLLRATDSNLTSNMAS